MKKKTTVPRLSLQKKGITPLTSMNDLVGGYLAPPKTKTVIGCTVYELTEDIRQQGCRHRFITDWYAACPGPGI